MGNRAVITASTSEDVAHSKDIGIYVHWNGGIDYIRAFLTYCKLKEYRKPTDDNYGWARLCAVIANCFDAGLSVGIDTCDHLDCANGNNGTYIIKGWDIVGRKYFSGQEQDEQKLYNLLMKIDAMQPMQEQMGPSQIRNRLNKHNIYSS